MKTFAALVLACTALAACGEGDRGLALDAGARGQNDGAAAEVDAGSSRDARTGEGEAAPAPELPNPALVVASGSAAEISVLDPESLHVVATFPVERALHPHHVGVSPDGTRVLVTALSADFEGGHAMHGAAGAAENRTLVYELDLEAGELAQVVDVPVTAHNAVYVADGRYTMLAMAEHGMVQSYDTYVFSESWWLLTGAGPLEVTLSRDGRFLVVCNASDDTLSVIDMMRQEVIATVEVAARPVGAWQSADGSLWVSSEAGRSVSLLAGEPTSVAAVIELTGVPGQAFETPDGAELWVALEDRGVVAVYDAESHAAIAEIAAGDRPHGLAFDPSGRRAFITDEAGAELLVADVATHEVTQRVSVGAGPNGVAFVQR